MNCLQLFLTWCSRTYLCLPSLSPDIFIAECKSSCKPCRESLPPATFLLHVCDCSYCFQISHLACSAQVLGASAQVPFHAFPKEAGARCGRCPFEAVCTPPSLEPRRCLAFLLLLETLGTQDEQERLLVDTEDPGGKDIHRHPWAWARLSFHVASSAFSVIYQLDPGVIKLGHSRF